MEHTDPMRRGTTARAVPGYTVFTTTFALSFVRCTVSPLSFGTSCPGVRGLVEDVKEWGGLPEDRR